MVLFLLVVMCLLREGGGGGRMTETSHCAVEKSSGWNVERVRVERLVG